MSEKQKKLDDLQEKIREIQRFPWHAIPPHTIDIGGMAAEIGCLVNAYQRVTSEGLDELPNEKFEQFSEATENVRSSLADLVSHIRSQRNIHPNMKNELENRLKEALPIVRRCADRAAATEAKRKELNDLIAKANEAQKQVTAMAEKAKTDIAELQDSSQKRVESTEDSFHKKAESMQGTVTQLGVSLHASFFKKEADKHVKSSIGWGIGALVFAVLLAAYAFFGDRLIVVELSNTQEWTPEAAYTFGQAVVTRILGFAILGYGLFFCARNYTAHRHNAVVNRHRQNALSTYRALARGNRDRENADIVLTHAARFIYAPQDSGYGRGGGMEGGDVSIFEPVRRAVDNTTKGKENN